MFYDIEIVLWHDIVWILIYYYYLKAYVCFMFYLQFDSKIWIILQDWGTLKKIELYEASFFAVLKITFTNYIIFEQGSCNVKSNQQTGRVSEVNSHREWLPILCKPKPFI